MSAHTPGPWAAFSDDSGSVVHTNIIAYVPRTEVVFSLPEHHKDDPNIRLITAAPDLLASLHELLAWQAAENHATPLIFLERARAAVAKAEGRS